MFAAEHSGFNRRHDQSYEPSHQFESSGNEQAYQQSYEPTRPAAVSNESYSHGPVPGMFAAEQSSYSRDHERSGDVPSTLTTTADPSYRSEDYSRGASTHMPTGETSAHHNTSDMTGNGAGATGMLNKAMAAVGLGGAAGGANVGASHDHPSTTSSGYADMPSQPTTTTGVSSYTSPTREGGPPKHYRRESIPTSAYPSGTLDGPGRAVSPPVGGSSAEAQYSGREQQYNRDVAPSAGLGGATERHEHEQNRQPSTTQSSRPMTFYDLATSSSTGPTSTLPESIRSGEPTTSSGAPSMGSTNRSTGIGSSSGATGLGEERRHEPTYSSADQSADRQYSSRDANQYEDQSYSSRHSDTSAGRVPESHQGSSAGTAAAPFAEAGIGHSLSHGRDSSRDQTVDRSYSGRQAAVASSEHGSLGNYNAGGPTTAAGIESSTGSGYVDQFADKPYSTRDPGTERRSSRVSINGPNTGTPGRTTAAETASGSRHDQTHYGRDTAVGAGLAGAGAYGGYEYGKHHDDPSRTPTGTSSVPHQSGDRTGSTLAPLGNPMGTRGAEPLSTTRQGVTPQSQRSEGHLGRDAAIGAGAVGAGAYGGHEYGKHFNDSSRGSGGASSVPYQSGNTAESTNVAQFGTPMGTRGSEPLSTTQQRMIPQSERGEGQVGRNAAAGAGLAGAGAYGGYEYGKHYNDSSRPTGTSSTPHQAANTTESATAAPFRGPMGTRGSEPLSTNQQGMAPQSQRDENHLGRNVAVGAGAAGVGAYSAHEYGQHEAGKVERESAEQRAVEQKRLEKQRSHEEKQRLADEKHHEKELAAEEKAREKAAEKEHRHHDKELEKEQKKEQKHHEKELEKEHKHQEKEFEKRQKEEQKHHEKELLAEEKAREKEEKDHNHHHNLLEKSEKQRLREAEKQQRERERHHEEAGVGAVGLGVGGLAAQEIETEHNTSTPAYDDPSKGLVAADSTDHQAHGHEEKKPGLLSRIFKRRKNKDTGVEEDYSTDEEDTTHHGHHTSGGTAAAGAGTAAYAAGEHEQGKHHGHSYEEVSGGATKPSYNPFHRGPQEALVTGTGAGPTTAETAPRDGLPRQHVSGTHFDPEDNPAVARRVQDEPTRGPLGAGGRHSVTIGGDNTTGTGSSTSQYTGRDL